MSWFLFPPGFCISPLQTCHLPWTHFLLEYWAGICRGASGHKVVRGREVKNGCKVKEKEIIWPPHQESSPLPTHDALRPRGAALPRSHAPLYHPNLLIVEAQLAHGGFLLQPTRINQAETAVESEQPLRPLVLHPSLLFAFSSFSFKWAWPKRWVFFWDCALLIPSLVLLLHFSFPSCLLFFVWLETEKKIERACCWFLCLCVNHMERAVCFKLLIY